MRRIDRAPTDCRMFLSNGIPRRFASSSKKIETISETRHLIASPSFGWRVLVRMIQRQMLVHRLPAARTQRYRLKPGRQRAQTVLREFATNSSPPTACSRKSDCHESSGLVRMTLRIAVVMTLIDVYVQLRMIAEDPIPSRLRHR